MLWTISVVLDTEPHGTAISERVALQHGAAHPVTSSRIPV